MAGSRNSLLRRPNPGRSGKELEDPAADRDVRSGPAATAGGPWTEERAMRVLVLGAGFGGLELSSRLSEQLGDEVEVTLIDKAEGFIFGFSKLDVMFGRCTADSVLHRYADVVKPGVRFVPTVIRSIDPAARDRRRTVRRRCDGRRARRRPRPGGHARPGRGGPRVLHRRRGVRLP